MSESKCPVTGGIGNTAARGGTENLDWWPRQLRLDVLHQQVCPCPTRWTRISTTPRSSTASTTMP